MPLMPDARSFSELLARFGVRSPEHLLAVANRWAAEISRTGFPTETRIPPPGGPFVPAYPPALTDGVEIDGWRFTVLASRKALKQWGRRAGNCLAGTSMSARYFRAIATGRVHVVAIDGPLLITGTAEIGPAWRTYHLEVVPDDEDVYLACRDRLPVFLAVARGERKAG